MYTIGQLSMLTGLTDRTLRNYLKSGILNGSKDTGVWQFTEQQASAFMHHPSVRPSIQAKQNAIVCDFLADRDQSEDELCILLHRRLEEEKAKELADFFCREACKLQHIRFSYRYDSGKGQYILQGAAEEVSRILADYSRLE